MGEAIISVLAAVAILIISLLFRKSITSFFRGPGITIQLRPMTEEKASTENEETEPQVSDFQSQRPKDPVTASEIFLSYASEDRERIQSLIMALEQQGWSVWWDRTIPPGKTFRQVIEAALDAAQCVVVVWSVASVDSEWVQVEAEEAQGRGILVPVRIDNVKIPLGFRQYQAADLIDWHGSVSDNEFKQLVSVISQKITQG